MFRVQSSVGLFDSLSSSPTSYEYVHQNHPPAPTTFVQGAAALAATGAVGFVLWRCYHAYHTPVPGERSLTTVEKSPSRTAAKQVSKRLLADTLPEGGECMGSEWDLISAETAANFSDTAQWVVESHDSANGRKSESDTQLPDGGEMGSGGSGR